MTYLLLGPFRLKIHEILSKLLWFEVENTPKSVPSNDNHFYDYSAGVYKNTYYKFKHIYCL